MKKLAFLVCLSVVLFSCSDDGPSSGGAKPSSISANGQVKTYTYDAKGRLSTISQAGQTSILTYNTKGKTDKITFEDGTFFQFAYDGNALVSITNPQNETFPVTSLGNNSYMIDNSVFSFNSAGDWTVFSEYTYTYENKKGAFANVKNLDLLAFYFADNDSYFYASKKRISALNYQGDAFPMVTIEGDNGFPATATVGNITITYTYAN